VHSPPVSPLIEQVQAFDDWMKTVSTRTSLMESCNDGAAVAYEELQ
jgi:hypothetical protein